MPCRRCLPAVDVNQGPAVGLRSAETEVCDFGQQTLAAQLWDSYDAAVASRLAYPRIRAALAAAARNHDLAEADLEKLSEPGTATGSHPPRRTHRSSGTARRPARPHARTTRRKRRPPRQRPGHRRPRPDPRRLGPPPPRRRASRRPAHRPSTTRHTETMIFRTIITVTSLVGVRVGLPQPGICRHPAVLRWDRRLLPLPGLLQRDLPGRWRRQAVLAAMRALRRIRSIIGPSSRARPGGAHPLWTRGVSPCGLAPGPRSGTRRARRRCGTGRPRPAGSRGRPACPARAGGLAPRWLRIAARWRRNSPA